MPALPWTRIAEPEPQREYLVMATRFVIIRRRHIPEFVRATQPMWSGLAASDGLLGYRLQIRLLHRTLSTLTAWRDRDAMNGFVRSAAHVSVEERTRDRMAGSTFISWSAFGVDLPPTWATADQHLGDRHR